MCFRLCGRYAWLVLTLCCMAILTGCEKPPINDEEPSIIEGKVPTGTVSLDEVTATTATFIGSLDISTLDLDTYQATLYYSADETFDLNEAEAVNIYSFDRNLNFKTVLKGLEYGTKYRYCLCVSDCTGSEYTDLEGFETNDVVVGLSLAQSVVVSLEPVAEFVGDVTGLSEKDEKYITVGVLYSQDREELISGNGTKLPATELSSDYSFAVRSEILVNDTKYFCRPFVKQDGVYTYGEEIHEFQTSHPYNVVADLNLAEAADLSSSGSANCYIVSQPGLYKFRTVKGNGNAQLPDVSSASIIWETFGNVTRPQMLDLISEVCYKDGYVVFRTNDSFKEGNAAIAAKNADGTILWSWHIWLTDQPESQEYYNDAGIMMDRNLGATSASIGDVGALGLLYQWGRKDPFLGACKTSSGPQALSTISWPERVPSIHATEGTINGTIEYAISHPTTFICYNNINCDWYYTGDETTDNTRWTTSESAKSVYDPCPQGWRVPDGGDDGVWTRALGTGKSASCSYNSGVDLSGHFGSSSCIWYPAINCLGAFNGTMSGGIYGGNYWSATPKGSKASGMFFNAFGTVNTDMTSDRAGALAVRCIQE